ncbi:MAG: nodulation protein NfeD [Armatimonadetes bacterium]|nr:nodulation protein NfeD [Armatimonadota bacterium]
MEMRGLAAVAVLSFALTVPLIAAPPDGPPRVLVATIDGAISPATALYLRRAILHATSVGAEAIVLRLDTPGGLLQSTEEMTKAILASPVPVLVYVTPQGGRAASAGVFILYSAHVAAMAPTTNIGAATPVTTGVGESDNDNQRTLRRKVTNDAVAKIRAMAKRRGRNSNWAERAVREGVSITADQAVPLRVADLVARDVPDLLARVDGRTIELPGASRRLRTNDARTFPFDQDARERFLGFLAHPNVGLVLMTVAVYGIVLELQNPGSIFPGIAGGIALLLAFGSFAVLEVNIAGLALIGLAVVLFIVELFVPGFGLLAGGGIVSFVLGALLLTSDHDPVLRTSVELAVLIALATAAFFGFAVRAGLRAQRGRPKMGAPTLIGEVGVVLSDVNPVGTIQARGEIWSAESVEGPIASGQRVLVVSVDGLRLRVRKEPAA